MKAYNKLNWLRIHYLTIESIYRNARGGVSKRRSRGITQGAEIVMVVVMLVVMKLTQIIQLVPAA